MNEKKHRERVIEAVGDFLAVKNKKSKREKRQLNRRQAAILFEKTKCSNE